MIRFGEWFVLSIVLNAAFSFATGDNNFADPVGSAAALGILYFYWDYMDKRAAEKEKQAQVVLEPEKHP